MIKDPIIRKKKGRERMKKHRVCKPWLVSYFAARERCTRLKDISYKNYGGRGIKFFMVMDDFKYLWFRDKAYKMNRASIDRIDVSKDYHVDNCRYVELSENISRSRRGRKLIRGKNGNTYTRT